MCGYFFYLLIDSLEYLAPLGGSIVQVRGHLDEPRVFKTQGWNTKYKAILSFIKNTWHITLFSVKIIFCLVPHLDFKLKKMLAGTLQSQFYLKFKV